MAWKLLMTPQDHWRRVSAPHPVALAKVGIEFANGEAEMLQCDSEPGELFWPTPWILAADAMPIHST
jgi:hypothetical protein